MPGGGTYSHTFAAAGTYSYHCSIHPSMKGTIIVQ
ncbi:MAG TPA: plastocyanin/azurin family copper-binding protein [Candidatus Omnitrophota bacterium]|nr:plastocyanin/azurin family copper-binding protein [Candidatus Omnitrophota bacterium]